MRLNNIDVKQKIPEQFLILYMHNFKHAFNICVGFERVSSISEKAKKNSAAIIRNMAAEFLRELSSRPDW